MVGKEKTEKLKAIAFKGIDKLLDCVVVEADLEEVKQRINKGGKERLSSLSYWHDRLSDYAIDGEMPLLRDEIEIFVNEMTSKKVVKKAKVFLKKAKKVEVVMSTL